MDGFEALVCTEMYKACTNDSDFWDFLTVESELGICDIADFIAQASEEYIMENLEEKYSRCTWDLVKMFFENNKSRWKSEICGEKYYKVRAVIEVDVLNDNMDSAVHEVEDCLVDAKSLFRDYASVKVLRVFSDDFDGSYEKR